MSILFYNRDGQTPVDESIRKDLIPDHINDMTELYESEIENIALGIEWAKTTKKNHRDYFTWLEVHKHMFNDVWKFAGNTRKVELNNPDFLMPYEILPQLKDLQENLIFWLENKTFDDRELMARVHERLLTIHPFKDGNGRWARLLVNMICEKQNIEVPSWGKEIKEDDKRRSIYISAVKKARKDDDYAHLISIMYEK
ncbi:MAG: mobile mystery protein B [Bacteriovoracaceae bacterium]|nr:mobile mystery protein B [Bacteriovoracaceae bacterium]